MHDERDQEDQGQLKIAASVDQHLAAHIDRVLNESVGNPKVLLDVLINFDRAVQVKIREVLRVTHKKKGNYNGLRDRNLPLWRSYEPMHKLKIFDDHTWYRLVYCFDERLRT